MVATDIFWVGLGGGTGSLLRWWVGLAVSKLYRGHFPLGTFLINVSGALIIGYLSALFGIDWRERYGEWLNAGLLTGVLGGYTTFSSMQLDAANGSCAPEVTRCRIFNRLCGYRRGGGCLRCMVSLSIRSASGA